MLDISKFEYEETEPFFQSLEKLEAERLIDKSYLSELSIPFNYRAVTYVRVSTKGQIDRYSISQQIDKSREICKQHKWEHLTVYGDPGISGTKFKLRGDFQEMISDAKLGKFDLIIALYDDRLGRNFREMTNIRADLLQHGVQIVSLDSPVSIKDPRLLRAQGNVSPDIVQILKDYGAQEELNKIKNRLSLGKEGKAKKGKIPVKTPFGYKKKVWYENGDPQKRKEVDEVVVEEAFVVRDIYRLYDKHGFGMRKIAEYLNTEKIPSPTGRTWCYSTIKYILQNPTYTGAVRWGWRLSSSKESRARLMLGHEGVITKGNHESIIEREQYSSVQKIMTRRKELGGKAVASEGLLVGIAKCGICGGGTYVTKYPNWLAYRKKKSERTKHKETQAYLCSSYSQAGRSRCERRYIMSKGKLEKLVLKEIKKLASSDEAREVFVLQMKKNITVKIKRQIRDFKKQLKQIDYREARQRVAYEKGVDDLQTYEKSREQNLYDRSSIREKIELKEKELAQEEQIATQNRSTILALADFDKVWEKADFNKKKELFQSILKSVLVHQNKIEIEFMTD